MYELETLVVPEELGKWLQSMAIGESEAYFSTIGATHHYWNTVIDSPLSDFIAKNKKELIEIIIGNREYEIEKPLYYALIKGHELSSNQFKYWNCKAYSSGELLIGSENPQDDFLQADLITRMTKKDWNTYGINDSNADFIERIR